MDSNHSSSLVDDDGNDVEEGKPGEILVKGPVVCKGYYVSALTLQHYDCETCPDTSTWRVAKCRNTFQLQLILVSSRPKYADPKLWETGQPPSDQRCVH